MYFVVFLLPLYSNSSHWFPLGSPKVFLVTASVSGMLLLLVWSMFGKDREKSLSFEFTYLHGALLLYCVTLAVSAFLGVDKLNSFFGGFQQSISLALIFTLGVFSYFIGFFSLKNDRFVNNILLASFISSICVAIISFFHNNSTIGNDSYIGPYALFNVCFGLILFFNHKKYWQRVPLGLGLATVVLSPVFFNIAIWRGDISFISVLHKPILFFGAANGAILGLGIAILVAIFLYMFRSKNKMVKMSGLFLSLCLVLSIFLVGYQLTNTGSIVNKVFIAEKTGSRFIFWDIAKSGFAERPWSGFGFGNYSFVYQKYFNPKIMNSGYTGEVWVNQPHNVFLEYLATTGVLGTGAFVVLFTYLLFVLFKSSIDKEGNRDIKFILLFGALAGYFIQDLFIFDVAETYFMFFLVLGVGISRAHVLYTFNLQNLFIKILAGVGISVASIYGFILLVFYPWQESEKMKLMVTTQNIDKIPQAIAGVQQISLMGNIEDTAYIYDQFLNQIEGSMDKITQENKIYVLNTIKALVVELEKESIDRPKDLRAELVTGRLANLYSMVDGKLDKEMDEKARIHLEIARTISPNNVLAYLALAQNRAISSDIKGAQEFIRTGMSLSPEYGLSYDFAKNLLKIYPDKDFENYVKLMEDKWILKIK